MSRAQSVAHGLSNNNSFVIVTRGTRPRSTLDSRNIIARSPKERNEKREKRERVGERREEEEEEEKKEEKTQRDGKPHC